jgi:hypothetical protein
MSWLLATESVSGKDSVDGVGPVPSTTFASPIVIVGVASLSAIVREKEPTGPESLESVTVSSSSGSST